MNIRIEYAISDICYYCKGHIHYGKPICTCGNKINLGVNMNKLTNKQVEDVIQEEGIGYAVTEYLSSSNIHDEELSQMWEEVSILLKDILGYLDIEE